jgi:hypothetical protein
LVLQLESKFIARIISDPHELEDSSGSDGAKVAVSEELVPYEFKSSWQCHTKDLIMEKIIPWDAQKNIMFLTGTKLLLDLNRQIIHVTASSQEACDLATHKLDILRKYHVS